MEIFYVEKSEFIQNVSILDLEKYSDGREYQSKEKYIEHLCGLYLVKNIASKYYGVKSLEFEVLNSKPYFKNREIFFSISHSKNIVAVGFSKNDIGLDVEFKKQRDFQNIVAHYGIEISDLNADKFYRFWTLHEAEIKLGKTPMSKFSVSLNEEYYLSCVSTVPMVSSFEIVKLRN